MFSPPSMPELHFPCQRSPTRESEEPSASLVNLGNEIPNMLSTHLFSSGGCRIRVYNGRIHTVPLDSPSLGYLCK